ncbi:MAG: type II secretion system protein M [Nevskia sp.]|nr:type II secretion system protein M [Nevskia sp.]
MTSLRERYDQQLQELGRQLAPLRTRFEALQPREQLFMGAAGVVVGLALIYLALWQPFASMRERRAHELDTARALASRIEVIGVQAQQTRSAGGVVLDSSVSLLSAVDRAAKDGTLSKAPSRMQPDGDNQVRVWIEDVSFDSLLHWMDALQGRYGLRIDGAAIERRPATGTVNARLSLVRGT